MKTLEILATLATLRPRVGRSAVRFDRLALLGYNPPHKTSGGRMRTTYDTQRKALQIRFPNTTDTARRWARGLATDHDA